MEKLAKKYRKKTYKRNIRNQNLKDAANMPYMESRDEVIEWFINNKPLRFVFENIEGALFYNGDTGIWQGVNYGKKDRKLIAGTLRTGWRNKVWEQIELHEVDLMPPLRRTPRDGDWCLERDEVLNWLKGKRELINFHVTVAALNGFIVPKEGGWIGVNNERK